MNKNYMMKVLAEDVVKKLHETDGINIVIRLANVGSYLLDDDEEEANENLGKYYMRNKGIPALQDRPFSDIFSFRDEVNKILRKEISDPNCNYEELFKLLVSYYMLNMAKCSDPKYFFFFEDEKKNFIQLYTMLIWEDAGRNEFGHHYTNEIIGANDLTSDSWLRRHLEWVKML